MIFLSLWGRWGLVDPSGRALVPDNSGSYGTTSQGSDDESDGFRNFCTTSRIRLNIQFLLPPLHYCSFETSKLLLHFASFSPSLCFSSHRLAFFQHTSVDCYKSNNPSMLTLTFYLLVAVWTVQLSVHIPHIPNFSHSPRL